MDNHATERVFTVKAFLIESDEGPSLQYTMCRRSWQGAFTQAEILCSDGYMYCEIEYRGVLFATVTRNCIVL